jgi:hypothetical protein
MKILNFFFLTKLSNYRFSASAVKQEGELVAVKLDLFGKDMYRTEHNRIVSC